MMRDYSPVHKIGSLYFCDIPLHVETLIEEGSYEIWKAYLHCKIDEMRHRNFFVYKVEELDLSVDEIVKYNVNSIFRLHLIKMKPPILELNNKHFDSKTIISGWHELK